MTNEHDQGFLEQSRESGIPVEVKIRPEFGVGGAQGKFLFLQSCRKKGVSIQSNDEISTYLVFLEKQQREHSSHDACSAIEKRHGVGYKKQNSVLQKFQATARDWDDQEVCSKPTTLDQSLMFGVFKKKTRQEELQFPEPCVPPNFDPHHIFTKEEEDRLDALLVSAQNDLVNNASKDGPTTSNNNRSNIDYYINPPSTPLPLLSLDNDSTISSTVKDDVVLALNQHFSSSTATSTVVTRPEKHATINLSSFTRSAPREALHTFNQNPLLFTTSSSSAKTPWNYGSGLIPIGNKPTHVSLLSAISIPGPAYASMSFLESIFEPSNEAVSHFGCDRAKNIDSKQTYDSHVMLDKNNWERIHSSSSRVNKSTTISSFRDTYTHTSSSSCNSSISSSNSRSTFHGDDSTKLKQHNSSIISKQIGGKYHQKLAGSCSSSPSSNNISLSSSDESLAIKNNRCFKATSNLPPVSSNEKKSTSGWSNFTEKKSGVGWGTSSEKKNGVGWGTSSEKTSGVGWGTSSENTSAGGWGTSSKKTSGGGWGNSSEKKSVGWGTSREKKSGGGWDTSSEKKSSVGWGTSREEKSSVGWGTSSEKKSGGGWGTSSEKKSACGWGQSPKWSDNEAVFGAWEKHTKGIGSKLLRKMGYRGSCQVVLPPVNKKGFGLGYCNDESFFYHQEEMQKLENT